MLMAMGRVILGLMGIGYGLWMTVWPEQYWNSWEKWLVKADKPSWYQWMYQNREWVVAHLKTTNPILKARLWGCALMAGTLVVELVVWRVLLYGPWE